MRQNSTLCGNGLNSSFKNFFSLASIIKIRVIVCLCLFTGQQTAFESWAVLIFCTPEKKKEQELRKAGNPLARDLDPRKSLDETNDKIGAWSKNLIKAVGDEKSNMAQIMKFSLKG